MGLCYLPTLNGALWRTANGLHSRRGRRRGEHGDERLQPRIARELRTHQHDEELDKKRKTVALKYVLELLSKRPDLIEASLFVAWASEQNGNDELAIQHYQHGIELAEALIPSNFKSKIDWGFTNNRIYHRLVFGYMRLCAWNGDYKTAIKLARQQLKLNPNDNLGVRFELPLLLAAKGEHERALTALKKLRGRDIMVTAHVPFNESLCAFARGDVVQGNEKFLYALFELPALRPIIIDGELPDMRDPRWHRGVIPDMNSMWFCFKMMDIESRGRIATSMRKLLDDPAIVRAEPEANAAYEKWKAALVPGMLNHDRLDAYEFMFEEIAARVGQQISSRPR